jgi:GT2 family glycosyltransferase
VTISIVIVNWNSGPFLEKCVRSIVRYASECQVVIVDNASTDDSLRFTLEFTGVLSVIRNDRNYGFAAGCNQGWHACTGEKILFLNPDIQCLPDSIKTLSSTFAGNESIWAVGGALLTSSGKHQHEQYLRNFPTIEGLASEMMLLDKIRQKPVPGVLDGTAIDVDQPAAACLMMTRNALEMTSGFDESFYPAWFEDVDLCLRIRNHGGRIRYQPSAVFMHHGGYSLGLMPRKDFLEHFHTNQIRYFRKHFGEKGAAHAKFWIVSGLLLRAALSLAHSPFSNSSRSAAAKTFYTAARHIMKLRESGL